MCQSCSQSQLVFFVSHPSLDARYGTEEANLEADPPDPAVLGPANWFILNEAPDIMEQGRAVSTLFLNFCVCF